ncbi:putative F-box protein At3g10430 [Bidens hawaiensis]|uniref:putative F-box protein At3g10430 n=1 Tax=Bidens hawaiensis TaxID=980011 RepID=UPI004049DE6F
MRSPPFDILVEIVGRLPVKSLLRFRSVSEQWKQLIDSHYFVHRYCGQQQHLIVSYYDSVDFEQKYVSIVEKIILPLTLPPLVNSSKCKYYNIIGSSYGLLCLYGNYRKGCCCGPISGTARALLWNPSIRKVVNVVVPDAGDGFDYQTILGFGVLSMTADPMIIKITHIHAERDGLETIPMQIQVFTLSRGAWRNPYGNLPPESIKFRNVRVVIDEVMYWLAYDKIANFIMSFDMTTEDFRQLNLPHSLAHFPKYSLSMCNLRESLVLLEQHGIEATSVWMMKDGIPTSFTKLYTVNASVHGFRNSGGESIILIAKNDSPMIPVGSFAIYEPYSKQIDNLGVIVAAPSLVFPYIETLLLLDQPDFIVYDNGERYIEN